MADALPAPPARRRRPGPGSAFLLVLATLITAHMPVVVGMGYAPWNAEVQLTLAALAGVAALSAALLYRVPLLLHAFACFWIYWALDAYLSRSAVLAAGGWFVALTGIEPALPTWALAAQVAPAVLLWLLLATPRADDVRAMVVAFSAVWFLGLWWSPDRALLQAEAAPPAAAAASAAPVAAAAAASAARPQALRPVLHFILDEQTSPRAPGARVPPGHPAQRIVDDYLARGFDYHTQLVSASGRTHKSLSTTMQLADLPAPQHVRSARHERFHHAMPDNAYIRRLQGLGYSVHVVQSRFLRICPPDGSARCETHSFGGTGPIGAAIQADLPSRLAILLFELDRAYTHPETYQVRAYAGAHAALRQLGLGQAYESVYYGNPVSALNMLAQLEERLPAVQPGQATIVHLLMPHFPYVTDADCRIKHYSAWTAPNRHLVEPGAERPLELLHRDYWDQAACTHRRILAIIDKVRATSRLDPIVVVHGDHGARIESSKDNLDNTDGADTDLLATFLAVHERGADPAAPAPRGAAIETPQPLTAAFQGVVARLGHNATAGAPRQP